MGGSCPGFNHSALFHLAYILAVKKKEERGGGEGGGGGRSAKKCPPTTTGWRAQTTRVTSARAISVLVENPESRCPTRLPTAASCRRFYISWTFTLGKATKPLYKYHENEAAASPSWNTSDRIVRANEESGRLFSCALAGRASIHRLMLARLLGQSKILHEWIYRDISSNDSKVIKLYFFFFFLIWEHGGIALQK